MRPVSYGSEGFVLWVIGTRGPEEGTSSGQEVSVAASDKMDGRGLSGGKASTRAGSVG